jgi:hypothetical protein
MRQGIILYGCAPTIQFRQKCELKTAFWAQIVVPLRRYSPNAVRTLQQTNSVKPRETRPARIGFMRHKSTYPLGALGRPGTILRK